MAISSDELAHISRALGDVARTATGEAGGRYQSPTAELALVEGVAPTFTAALTELARAGITPDSARGARIEAITLQRGSIVGPFTVRYYRVADEPDGMIELGLEVVS